MPMNRRILLAARPEGSPGPQHFKLAETFHTELAASKLDPDLLLLLHAPATSVSSASAATAGSLRLGTMWASPRNKCRCEHTCERHALPPSLATISPTGRSSRRLSSSCALPGHAPA